MIKCLYEPFRKWSEKGSVYLYSDPHFGDADSYARRFPCQCDSTHPGCEHCDGSTINCPKHPLSEEDIRLLDEMQIKNINKRVTKKDTIIFLGDIGNTECIKKIKGYKVLIMGNHDKGASNYKRKIEEVSYFNSGDMSQQDAEQFKINGLNMLLYPDRLKELLDKNRLIADKYLKKRKEDNHLFDEVYEGPLMITDKILLSHEPIHNLPPYIFNIHGHDHSGYEFMKYVLKYFDSEMAEKEMLDNYVWTIKKEGLNKLNICAEWTAYNPVNLQNDLIKKGLFSKTKDIHKDYIDKRNGRI